MPIDGFSQSVSGIQGVVNRERAEDLRGESPIIGKFHCTKPKVVGTLMHLICLGFDLSVRQPLLETGSIHPQQLQGKMT